MEQQQWRRIIFYAVVLKDKIGIFTDWQNVNKSFRRSNRQKCFRNYFKALKFIRDKLSDGEIKAYGIDVKNMKWNKWYFKKYPLGIKDSEEAINQWKNKKK